MYGNEMRWRAVTLVYAYCVPADTVGRVLGVSGRPVRRWYQQFKTDGHVNPQKREHRCAYPESVVAFISQYVATNPCFYVEELRDELKRRFADLLLPMSHSTILRVLRFDLKLSRKVLERRAREALPLEIAAYKAKMAAFYSYPEQLMFVDETAKKSADSVRKYAWSRRGTKAIVRTAFRKGERVSVLAACDTRGFVAWTMTRGTFTRNRFHEAMVKNIIPLLNPWPLPRSILVLDNARIHHYRELEDGGRRAKRVNGDG